MTQLEAAKITVIEHEINTLRGLRLSPNTAIAQLAVERERLREAELEEFRAGITQQGLLPFVAGQADHDEEPVALAASKQGAGGGK